MILLSRVPLDPKIIKTKDGRLLNLNANWNIFLFLGTK